MASDSQSLKECDDLLEQLSCNFVDKLKDVQALLHKNEEIIKSKDYFKVITIDITALVSSVKLKPFDKYRN